MFWVWFSWRVFLILYKLKNKGLPRHVSGGASSKAFQSKPPRIFVSGNNLRYFFLTINKKNRPLICIQISCNYHCISFPGLPITKYHKVGGWLKTTEYYSFTDMEAGSLKSWFSKISSFWELWEGEPISCLFPASDDGWLSLALPAW